MSTVQHINGKITLGASPGFDLVHISENGEIVRRMKSVLISSDLGLLDWVEMPEERQ